MTEERCLTRVETIYSMIENDFYFVDEFDLDVDEIVNLFSELGLSLKEFEDRGFVFSDQRNLLVSLVAETKIYISTRGLLSRPIPNDVNIYYSYRSHAEILIILLDEIIKLKTSPDVYYVGGETFKHLEQLSLSLIQNYVFYLELMCKAYLQLNNAKFKYLQDLNYLLSLVNNEANKVNNNDSIFLFELNKRIKELSISLLQLSGVEEHGIIQTKLKYGEYVQNLCISLEIDFESMQLNIHQDTIMFESYIFDENSIYFESSRLLKSADIE